MIRSVTLIPSTAAADFLLEPLRDDSSSMAINDARNVMETMTALLSMSVSAIPDVVEVNTPLPVEVAVSVSITDITKQ